ncbi:arginine repressor [Oligoflexus tunisiensis]|uniref:arginine repressor n=1 Tax=Oligoflexus tunisiensis TaxID=708132 RepID=UPI000A3F7C4E|nr:ArgR family transcriptional regulator [Oligoflexus tunisiensis]
MLDQNRLSIIADVIRNNKVSNQHDLKEHLKGRGFDTTQSSISRDLKKLGVVKVEGFYKTPSIAPGESSKVDRLDATTAGDNLIILKTGPGNANRAGVVIDRANIPGILGTIAGDDTIFVAVANRQQQAKVLRRVFALFD